LTIRDGRKETERKPTPKQLARRHRTIELNQLGLKHQDTLATLTKENIKSSLHTISDDLGSCTTDEYRAELERQQKADISLSKDPRLRMEYRDRLIDRLTPRRTETKIDGNLNLEQRVVNNLDINEELKLIDEAISRNSENEDILADSSEQPMDQTSQDQRCIDRRTQES
jgi:hypothetical protein